MTVLLKGGATTEDPRLDRVPTGHTKHLDRYPLTAETLPGTPVPIQMGINWYSNFDDPIWTAFGKGRGYFVIGKGELGTRRGGHATVLRHRDLTDVEGWWTYYNQGKEGRCVEFSGLRLLSLLNRKRYDITSKWHYHEAQRIDYWAGGSYEGANPVYEGTSVDAFMQVATKQGVIVAKKQGRAVGANPASLAQPAEGLSVYRWALNWQDVRTVLGVPDWMPGVPMLNSWGKGYPREVILLDEAGERVLREDGEFAVPTDR